MSDLRNAAKQALEALEAGPDVDPIFAGETEDALRAALAEPEQENQALIEWKEKGEAIMAQAGIGFRLGEWWADRPWNAAVKYEAPLQHNTEQEYIFDCPRCGHCCPQAKRKPLTEEEIVDINNKHYDIAFRDFDADIAIARDIEAAHGIGD